MKRFFGLPFIAAACFLTASPAFADSFSLSLTTMDPTVAPGSTVTFFGTLTATPGNAGPIFLLNDTLNVDSPLTDNDDDFYANTPTSLTSANPFSGALFTITVQGTAAGGLYNGNFTVLASDNQDDTLTKSAAFQVTVPAATTAVTPEPSTLLLLFTGLAGATQLRRKSKQAL